MFATVLVFITTCILVLWGYYRFKTRRMIALADKLPGPKPLPLFGNVLELGTTPTDIFNNLVRLRYKYGTIGRFWIGPILTIGISNPAHIEVLLNSYRNLDKAIPYKFLHPWLGQGLLTGTGQKWKIHRKLITPAFHFKILEGFVDVFNANADILIKQLAVHIDGPEFDVYEFVTLCALDNICETAMGVNVNAQNDSNSEYVKATRSTCRNFMMRSIRPWLHSDFLFKMSSLGKQQARSLQVLHGMTNRVIRAKRQELLLNPESHQQDNEFGVKKRIPFLDLMMQNSQDGDFLTDEEVREEVDTIMFEGHDTISSAISFTCYMLASHQNVQERVITELTEIFGDSEWLPTYHDLQEMKYLEQVIKETLRLYPSVPLFGRLLTEDIDLGDYILPAGANVFVAVMALNRSDEFYSDAENFNPDRFLPENIQNRHPYGYIPFAAGPRNCIGQKYAMLEMKATLCQLLRNYKLLPGETEVKIHIEIVLKSSTGINIKLQARQNKRDLNGK